MRPFGSIRAHQRRLHHVERQKLLQPRTSRAVKMAALFDSVAVSVENEPPAEQKPQRRPRFWIGPVVAGSCFALGFGVTQRLVALQGRPGPTAQQTFGAQRFPGSSLESLTSAGSDKDRPLFADVAAREAELAKTRPAKPKQEDDKAKQEAARLAAEARLRRQRTAAARAPVVPAVAVTEPVQNPAPELPSSGEADASETVEIERMPESVALPDPSPPAPLAAEPISEPAVAPATPVPVAVPTPAAPPAP